MDTAHTTAKASTRFKPAARGRARTWAARGPARRLRDSLGAPLDAIYARRLGTAVAGLLAADAVVHAVWTTGVTWPAGDARALSFAVLNADVPFTPRVLLPLCALLVTAASGVYGYAVVARRPLVRKAGRLMTAAVAAGLAVRALTGVAWACGVGSDVDTPFYWLNLLVYTPLCLGFGYAAARLAAGVRSAAGAQAG
jgi:hypothetical protein